MTQSPWMGGESRYPWGGGGPRKDVAERRLWDIGLEHWFSSLSVQQEASSEQMAGPHPQSS